MCNLDMSSHPDVLSWNENYRDAGNSEKSRAVPVRRMSGGLISRIILGVVIAVLLIAATILEGAAALPGGSTLLLIVCSVLMILSVLFLYI
jgi:hypothetical protein